MRIIKSLAATYCCTLLLACGTEPGVDLDASDAGSDVFAQAGGQGKGKGKVKDGGGEATYNCKPDKLVDVPMELSNVEVQSAMRVRFQSVAGEDASGTVEPLAYIFENDAGERLYARPDTTSSCALDRTDDPYDFTVEPVPADTHFKVFVQSKDVCGNVAESAPVEITTPAAVPESNGPTVTEARNTRVTIFIGSMPGLGAFAQDDTAIDYVEFYANGVRQGRAKTYTGLHGWSESQDAGEIYYTYISSSDIRGTTAEVEVHAYDVFGNVTISTTNLAIPK